MASLSLQLSKHSNMFFTIKMITEIVHFMSNMHIYSENRWRCIRMNHSIAIVFIVGLLLSIVIITITSIIVNLFNKGNSKMSREKSIMVNDIEKDVRLQVLHYEHSNAIRKLESMFNRASTVMVVFTAFYAFFIPIVMKDYYQLLKEISVLNKVNWILILFWVGILESFYSEFLLMHVIFGNAYIVNNFMKTNNYFYEEKVMENTNFIYAQTYKKLLIFQKAIIISIIGIIMMAISYLLLFLK